MAKTQPGQPGHGVDVVLMCYDCGSERSGEVIATGKWRCSLCYTVRGINASGRHG